MKQEHIDQLKQGIRKFQDFLNDGNFGIIYILKCERIVIVLIENY